ncbi:MAG: hypothetical protein R6V06_10020 [Kiritimatiellia bacterium]
MDIDPTAVTGIRDPESVKLIHKGKWANANVYRFLENRQYIVRKGFCSRPLPIRWTLGAFFVWREISILNRLAGITGVPRNCRRCREQALCYRYIDGETLGEKWKKREMLPESYFIEAEKLLFQIHNRKIVHLDLRKATNWIVQPDSRPAIIDYQSAVSVSFLPRKLRNFLYLIDYSGLYKFWDRLCEEPLDPERRKLLDRVNRLRQLWIFKGYIFKGMIKPSKRKSRK